MTDDTPGHDEQPAHQRTATNTHRELKVGDVTLDNDGTIYILRESDRSDRELIAQELGDRRFPEAEMFELGADCPLPHCHGQVVDVEAPRRRICSDGCLEWIRGYPADGEDCHEHGCDGVIQVLDAPGGQYKYECSTCGLYAAGVADWREAWQPFEEETALDHLRNPNPTGGVADAK